ncbi:MAG: MFS transporter [Pseudomonadota bacterium]
MSQKRLLSRLTIQYLPFADAASEGFPLREILRLSLFQISVGMATVLLLGTLNRVMIVELGVPAMVVAAMIALPVLVGPLRAAIGFKSDTHRSAIGWKRVPFIWFGSLWQFGGLAIMPFALLVLGGDTFHSFPFDGEILAALAFIMTGWGIAMTQTAGLALASDRATDETRPRVVALRYVMFLVGMGVSSLIVGWLLQDFTPLKLIQVVQGAAVVTVLLNTAALWKQEQVRPMSREERAAPKPAFRDAWADFMSGGQAGRLIAVVALGTLAFNMQDVLLEPYGGEILGLSVSATTLLTAAWAFGALAAFALSAKWLAEGRDAFRMAANGILYGIAAFSAVIFAAPLDSTALFFVGAAGIGFGGGLFAVATLTAAMTMPQSGTAGRGLALGAWGAAQATAAGLAIFVGGTIRDVVHATSLPETLGPATGYSMVYHVEIALLFATLAVLGPLVKLGTTRKSVSAQTGIGLADLPT